jgi:hypothetical protein
VPYKLFISTVRDGLEPLSGKITGEYRPGFRKARSTTDQIFTVIQILQKCLEINIGAVQILNDFQHVYDSTDRTVTGYIMKEFRIPGKLVTLVELTMHNTLVCVKVQREMGNFFEVKQGLKQGDGLAPLLFNLALEHVI